MRFDSWLTLSGTGMDFDALVNLPTPGADFGGTLTHPTSFAAYADPDGRFLLRYPRGWLLKSGVPTEVRSIRLPLGATVQILSGPDASWEALRATVVGPGGLLVGEHRLPGPPRQLRGEIVRREGLVEVRALAFPGGAGDIVLSTWKAPGRVPGLDRFGRAVLSAIRREFTVPPVPSVR